MIVDKFGKPPPDASGPNREFLTIWDLGPTRPEAPTRPELKEEPGTPEAELERIEVWPAYAEKLKAYVAAKQEYERWHKTGPRPLTMAALDAKAAVAHDRERYVFGLPADKFLEK